MDGISTAHIRGHVGCKRGLGVVQGAPTPPNVRDGANGESPLPARPGLASAIAGLIAWLFLQGEGEISTVQYLRASLRFMRIQDISLSELVV